MEKLLTLGIFLFLAFPAFAASYQKSANYRTYNAPYRHSQISYFGIEEGSVFLSGQLGGSISTDDIDGVEWGDKGGVSYGLQALLYPSKYFGIGLEVSGNNFLEASSSWNYIGLGNNAISYYTKVKEVNIYNLLLAARFNINPQNRVRVYIPAGVGLARASFKGDITVIDHGSGFGGYGSLKENSTDFTYYAGLGMEVSVNSRLVLGLEARYNNTRFKLDDDKVTGKYLTGLFKIGVKL